MTSSTPFLLLVALLLGFAAQTFINGMLQGEQGLGAFLQDGPGYNKSSFKPSSNTNRTNRDDADYDPLPWLSLPRLDFVDVAGQQPVQEELVANARGRNDDITLEQLERVRQEMNTKLKEGKIEQALALREELQVLMKESGFEFEATDT